MTKNIKNIVITGGTSGIGLSFKKLCLEDGHKVQSLQRTIPEHQPSDYNIIGCDLTSEDSMRMACELLDGDIDIFMHCAGIMLAKSLPESSYDDIQKMMQVNLSAPLYLISKIIPKLSKRALIIVLGSQSAYKGSYDDLYAITKAGIHGLVGTLSPKLAPHHRIINVAPGITTGTRMTDLRTETDLETARDRVPLKRLAHSDEIAKICYSLAGHEFDYMTGNTIDINGGNHIR